MSAYTFSMSIRTLFAIVIALAVLLSPALTRAGEASAAVPDGHMQMMESGPCKMPPAKSGDHGAMDKTCSMTMCAAVAIDPSAPADAPEPKQAATYFAVPKSWHGYLGEIATPPPRTA